MEHQRICQGIFNWLQVNQYVQHEPEQQGQNGHYIHGAYRVDRRDPFYIDDSELPTETLVGLNKRIAAELEKRK